MSEAAKEFFLEEDEEQGFAVLDDSSAEWCLRKIKEKQSELATWEAFYAEQLEKVRGRIKSDINFFEIKLKEYFDQIPHKKTKTQESYSLPGGKLILKAQDPTYDVKDEELVPWLKQNDLSSLVKTKFEEKADWAKLKKQVKVAGDGVVTEDGEIVPGVKVVPRPEIFKVEVM